jgi:hypothetical protein
MFKTKYQGHGTCAHVYRATIAHIDQVLELAFCSAALWVKGDNGETHLLQVCDPIWRDTLIAQRTEMQAKLAEAEEIERAPSAA